jgi:enoyl-CoA hydratase/carnithine racemase
MVRVQDCQTSCFSLHIRGPVAEIKLTGDIYELGTCQATKDAFFSVLQSVNISPEIRVLLLLDSPGVLSDEKFCSFFSNALEARIGGRKHRDQAEDYGGGKLQIENLANTLNRVVMAMFNFKKLLIVGFEGEVAPIFFGASLAADYRYGSDEMTFHPSHFSLGVTPSGGLGYFLPQLIGLGKSKDLLFSDEPTSSHELYRLGLLDGQFPNEIFRAKCENIAEDLARKPVAVIEGIKSIFNFHSRDLRDFFEYEEKVTAQVMARKLSQER